MAERRQPTIAQLHKQLQQLRELVSWQGRILEAHGVPGPWLSPAKAAPLLGVSRDRVMDEIRLAEQLRLNGKKSDLSYGVHYRNIGMADSQSPTWQVHLGKFGELLAIPPEQRKV